MLSYLDLFILPKELKIFESDLLPCHIGIFVGMTSESKSPFLLKDYNSKKFCELVLLDIPDVDKKGMNVILRIDYFF